MTEKMSVLVAPQSFIKLIQKLRFMAEDPEMYLWLKSEQRANVAAPHKTCCVFEKQLGGWKASCLLLVLDERSAF